MGVPASSRESVDDSTRVQQLTGDARTPPSRLTIIQKDTAIAIADDQGHARTFRPDGHLAELTIGTVPLPTTARWDGASLVVVYDVETGRQLRYTYTPAADPTRLQVNIRFLERGREGDEVRLTYEPPGAHERAILSGAPASPAAPSASASTSPGVPDAAPPSARPPVLPPGSELRGLTTIGTVVEDLSAQGKACGLDQEKIKTSIARILADAGFKTERFGNEDTYVVAQRRDEQAAGRHVRVAIRRIARDAGRRDVSVPEGSCRTCQCSSCTKAGWPAARRPRTRRPSWTRSSNRRTVSSRRFARRTSSPRRDSYRPPPRASINRSDSRLTKILRVVPLAPAERRHVPILAQRSAAVSLLETCPQGRPNVGIGPAVQQQAREARFVRLPLP